MQTLPELNLVAVRKQCCRYGSDGELPVSFPSLPMGTTLIAVIIDGQSQSAYEISSPSDYAILLHNSADKARLRTELYTVGSSSLKRLRQK